MNVEIIEDQETYLMIAQDDRFAIVERRNNRLYHCHDGKRDGIPLDQLSEIGKLLNPHDWMNEATARAAFENIVGRSVQLREMIR